MRFYPISSGVISLDGIDINQYDKDIYNSLIGWVSQDPITFSGTIEDNIKLGNPNATIGEVEAAAKVNNNNKINSFKNTSISIKKNFIFIVFFFLFVIIFCFYL